MYYLICGNTHQPLTHFKKGAKVKITIPSYQSYKYKEVWRILSFKDGCPWDLENTNKYIKVKGFNNPLDRKKYSLASVSTHLLEDDNLTIDVEPLSFFN